MEGLQAVREIARLMGVEADETMCSLYRAMRGSLPIYVRDEWIEMPHLHKHHLREVSYLTFREMILRHGSAKGRDVLSRCFSIERVATFIDQLIREEAMEERIHRERSEAYKQGVSSVKMEASISEESSMIASSWPNPALSPIYSEELLNLDLIRPAKRAEVTDDTLTADTLEAHAVAALAAEEPGTDDADMMRDYMTAALTEIPETDESSRYSTH